LSHLIQLKIIFQIKEGQYNCFPTYMMQRILGTHLLGDVVAALVIKSLSNDDLYNLQMVIDYGRGDWSVGLARSWN